MFFTKMFEKKCVDCGKKVKRGFNFCPFCGAGFKSQGAEEDYGMLGTDDFVEPNQQRANVVKLPFGLNKVMGGLMKQLDRELREMIQEDMQVQGMPRGFQIKISSGQPKLQKVVAPVKRMEKIHISGEENERRKKLPRIEAESQIRRLGDFIVYEISTPGVNKREQVVIAKLEEGLEVKAYSKDKCYYKVIPLRVEIARWGVFGEKVVVELKG